MNDSESMCWDTCVDSPSWIALLMWVGDGREGGLGASRGCEGPCLLVDTGRYEEIDKRGLIGAMGNDEDVVTWGLSPTESQGVRDREGDWCVDVCRCA